MKNKISARDIPFEEGKEQILLDLANKFVAKFTFFIEKNIPTVAKIKNVSEEKVKTASIYAIFKTLAKDPGDIAVTNKCSIKDVAGVERNIYFKINMTDKPISEMDGFFKRHHAGASTLIPRPDSVESMRKDYNIPDFNLEDRVINVDMSAMIPFNKFITEKSEAVTCIFGELSHELSHAYNIRNEKSVEKYQKVMKKIHDSENQVKEINKILNDNVQVSMMAANLGKTPDEMAEILQSKFNELKTKYMQAFGDYVNTPDEIASALKEMRVFVNALASGEFVKAFNGIRQKFKKMPMERKQQTIKQLLESMGTWHNISKFLNESNRKLVFKFIYRLLTEPDKAIPLPPAPRNVIQLRESYPSPDQSQEEFEIAR